MKKAPLICAVAILAIAAAVIIAAKTETKAPHQTPARVTLLRSEESEIVTLSYRDYLTGCLFGLMQPSSSEEALKAAACAASSAAMYRLAEREGFVYSGADLTDDEDCLPYISPDEARSLYGEKYPRYLEKLRQAADFGASHLLIYDEKPIYAAMCGISTGRTDNAADVTNGDFPYLKAADAEADREAVDYESVCLLSPSYAAEAIRSAAEIPLIYADCGEWFGEERYTDSGTLISVEFCGKEITGAQLREALGLRSAAVSIEYGGDRFAFTCRGYGGNLGMSLNAAEHMALRGMTAEEILAYFYPSAELIAAT